MKALDQLFTQLQQAGRDEDQRLQELGNQIGDPIAKGLSTALRGVLQGEAVDFGEILANTASRLLENQLDDVIENASRSLSGLLNQISGGDSAATGQGGGLGGGRLGGALAGGLAIGGALLAGALRDTEASIRSDLAEQRTEVTDTRPVRGVVAGPTSIPIFEVGNSIEEAFEGTNEILREILDAIRRSGGAAAAGGGAEPSAGEQLGQTSPTLF